MNDPAKRVDDALAAGAADDWLAGFAKKSQEALAKQAEEKANGAARPDDKALMAALARQDRSEYDRVRIPVAETLGIRVGTLDDKVEAFRKKARTDPKKPPLDIPALMKAAGDLITCSDILEKFAAVITKAGLVGETNNAKILYLALTSRLFDRPISVAVKGVSSGGKSFTVESVLKFFPNSAYFARTACSDKALYFSEESFQHRVLVLYEALGLGADPRPGMETNHFAYAVRSLLSENRLRYELPIKPDEGIKSQVISKEGPTGLITTTTTAKLHPENETRLLSLGVVDTPDQTKAVMQALASGAVDASNYSPWHALQEWLTTGERRVAIPFAHLLADAIPPIAVRLRRDFRALLSLIHAHALLHRQSRARDECGRIVATVTDYAAVYHLVEKLFGEGIEATVPKIVRETVEAVGAYLGAERASSISVTALAKELGLDKAPTHHRVGKAIKAGYLVNQQDRRGKPAQIVLGDPLPEDKELLPPPATVEAAGEYTLRVGTPPEMTATPQQLCKKPSPEKDMGAVVGTPTVPPAQQRLQHPLTPCQDSAIGTTVAVLQTEQEGWQHPGIPVGVRPATNGRAAPGAYMDAQGKPTDDPELGYYGRAARAPLDAAYQAATEKQPDAVADVPDPAGKTPP